MRGSLTIAVGVLALVACSTEEPQIVSSLPPGEDAGGGGSITPTPGPDGGRVGCSSASECDGGRCVDGVCLAATATDGVKNGDESDVDCGGSAAPKCADGKACKAPDDCVSKVCKGGVCAAPSATDLVKNGGETDVDCGGASAATPRCAPGKACIVHGDCTRDACREGVCAHARSCRQKYGGGTCGPGEVGVPGAKHEDCCVAVTVPRPAASGGPFELDKYLITAGRMRAFLEEVKYDVRGWVEKNRPPWWTGTGTTTWDAMLPTTADEFLSFSATGGSGCYVGAGVGDNGAPAFWAPAADLLRVIGGAPRAYTKDELDTKVMNCFRAPLFHALCAFDGGRLPSRDEWIEARTVAGEVLEYPWGTEGSDAERRARASYDFDYWWPRRPTAADRDLGGYLPAPGRFPLGNGPFGHADLLGAVENMGSRPNTGAGVRGDGWFQFSFQEPEIAAHPYGQQSTGFGAGTYRPHWAVGARCVKLP